MDAYPTVQRVRDDPRAKKLLEMIAIELSDALAEGVSMTDVERLVTRWQRDLVAAQSTPAARPMPTQPSQPAAPQAPVARAPMTTASGRKIRC